MHSRAVRIKKFGLLTIRPLRQGDTETIAALFDRLGTEPRARRLNGPKPGLSDAHLTKLATVDSRRHTLVAYVDGDPKPAGIARLVRDPNQWTHAEIAVAVADCYHGLHIGSTLFEFLVADARAAGITKLTDTLQGTSAAPSAVVREVSLEPGPRAGRRSRGAAAASSCDSGASWQRAAGASRSL
jgi:GNAT superfamily N-acetyltransferase